MSFFLFSALALLQTNPGLPPPWPADGPFDVPAVCYVVTTADADRLHAEGRDHRMAAAAGGYFSAEVARIHPGREQEVILRAKKKIGDHPERYRLNCYDAYNVAQALLKQADTEIPK